MIHIKIIIIVERNKLRVMLIIVAKSTSCVALVVVWRVTSHLWD